MKGTALAIAILAMSAPAAQAADWTIAVHGGAGGIVRERLRPDQDAAYRAALERATRAGAEVLEAGGSALDAVEASVRLLEDDPLFNAGRGAVLTADGKVELDASIMDGSTLAAGAVAGVSRTRNPISLARAVMEHSPHVMLSGDGADAFARARKLEQVDPSYFITERRWESLETWLTQQKLPIPARPASLAHDEAALLAHDEGKRGTVGAVARDAKGRLAVATSTGGTMGKRWGRVGDSPIIGAGSYADKGCAVSGTGTGEYFIRLTVARSICALVELKGLSLQAAVDQVVQKDLTALGGDGGAIAVGKDGEAAWSFNSTGMNRARLTRGGELVVSLYKDEP